MEDARNLLSDLNYRKDLFDLAQLSSLDSFPEQAGIGRYSKN